MNAPPGGDGSKEMAEFYKHRDAFLNFAKRVPTMRPGKSGSMTKMILFQTHTLFMTGSRAFAALWVTPPGRYLAAAIFVSGAAYNYRQAQLEKAKNAALIRQQQAEKAKQDQEIKQAQLKVAQFEQQLETVKNERKTFEEKAGKELDQLKTVNTELQRKFEDSQKSWISDWFPFFKSK